MIDLSSCKHITHSISLYERESSYSIIIKKGDKVKEKISPFQ